LKKTLELWKNVEKYSMKNQILLIGGAILASLLLFRKAAAARAAKVLFRGIRLAGKGLKRNIEIKLAVQNASSGSATLKALTGEVFINGKQVADFSRFGDQRIEARSESPLNLNATLSAGIISILASKGWLKSGINYEIKGFANFDGINTPFSFSGKLSA
jgi:hypothetical protein